MNEQKTKAHHNCETFRNYDPILDRCAYRLNVRSECIRYEGCGKWARDE